MKIVMTGSSGLVGSALASAFGAAGHNVLPLVRRGKATTSSATWDPMADAMDPAPLQGCEVFVHLAGESLAEGRWTEAKKKRLIDSRVRGTGLLSRTIASLQPRPRVLISASAVGYYGDRGEEILTEDSPPGSGFAADLCRQWEQATEPAEKAGIRVVHLRLGIVLSKRGGALAKMLTPFRLGLGGVLGNGRQYVGWIEIDDVVAVVRHLIDQSQLAGAVNAVSPNPVTNRELTRALGHALHRPTFMAMPAFAARLAFGEMADVLLLASARVVPKRLEADGFKFRYPNLDGALSHVLAGT